MRWFLFLLTLWALYFGFAMFAVAPGPFNWPQLIMGLGAILFATLTAWLSAAGFVGHRSEGPATATKLLKTPPGFIWAFVVTAFCIVGVIRLITRLLHL